MIEVGDNKYEIVENVNNCFNEEIFKELYTDYFGPFDYIFGDFSYGKVRLKGFNDSQIEYLRQLLLFVSQNGSFNKRDLLREELNFNKIFNSILYSA